MSAATKARAKLNVPSHLQVQLMSAMSAARTACRQLVKHVSMSAASKARAKLSVPSHLQVQLMSAARTACRQPLKHVSS
jgi:hypothetical protein